MNNEIKVFMNDKFGEIRTITIDGQIYFVGTDVAKALDYKNPRDAIRNHVDKDDVVKRYPISDSLGRIQKTNLINESGFYSLVLASKIKGAKEFKHWVTSEVIPSIRKTGAYAPRIEQSPTVYIETLNIYAGGKTMKNDKKDRIKPFLGDYINEITKKSKGKDQYICPFCGSGTGPNGTGAFTYYPETRTYNCFKCGENGDIFTLYAHENRLALKRTFPESLRSCPLNMVSAMKRTGQAVRQALLNANTSTETLTAVFSPKK